MKFILVVLSVIISHYCSGYPIDEGASQGIQFNDTSLIDQWSDTSNVTASNDSISQDTQQGLAKKIGEKVKEGIKTVKDKVKGGFDKVKEKVKGGIDKVKENIKNLKDNKGTGGGGRWDNIGTRNNRGGYDRPHDHDRRISSKYDDDDDTTYGTSDPNAKWVVLGICAVLLVGAVPFIWYAVKN